MLKFFNIPVDLIAGQAEQTFWVDVANVTSPVHTEIDASVDGVSGSIPVRLSQAWPSSPSPRRSPGGDSATGTLSLAGQVDIATTVYLSSTQGILTVPPSVTIPAGQSSATFPITTVQVTSDSQVILDALLGDSQLSSGIIDVTP